MKVEVLYIDGCPNYRLAVERLRKVLGQQGISIEPAEIEIHDEIEAKEMGFLGSPTIRVNGLDIAPESCSGTVTGLACRYYAGGLPSEDMISVALRQAEEKR